MDDNLEKLSELDARWFLRAINAEYVTEKDGLFFSGLSAASEQIFWEGPKAGDPRKITLWLEPIITIGVLARLIDEYHWPETQVGLQSKAPWPFDFIGYDENRETELLAGEVKKSEREIDRLVDEMARFSAQPVLAAEPENPASRNAYRKVVGIRQSWPKVFWAIGPNGKGRVFAIARAPGSDKFSMKPVSFDDLHFRDRS